MVSMLLATLLLFAQDAGDHGKCEAKEAPSPWISRERDYPAADAAAKHEGRVNFTIDVDAEGCPSKCTVTLSSGYPSLDDVTCELTMRNGAFVPRRDYTGARIASDYRISYAWYLQEPLAPGATAPEPIDRANWVLEGDYP